jgi:hypothetical protein
MNSLPNGFYKTKAGSQLEISGSHGGIVRLSFDWCEEPDACCECRPDPYPQKFDENDFRITWNCTRCDGGSAQLFPNEESRTT